MQICPLCPQPVRARVRHYSRLDELRTRLTSDQKLRYRFSITASANLSLITCLSFSLTHLIARWYWALVCLIVPATTPCLCRLHSTHILWHNDLVQYGATKSFQPGIRPLSRLYSVCGMAHDAALMQAVAMLAAKPIKAIVWDGSEHYNVYF